MTFGFVLIGVHSWFNCSFQDRLCDVVRETSFAIHKEIGTGRYNQMYPRCGVLSRNEMVTSFVTPTANRMLAAYRAAGERMPQAIVIGAHPAWELCGCYSHPHDDWWEMELFESVTGCPGQVVRCKTVDLVVPRRCLDRD